LRCLRHYGGYNFLTAGYSGVGGVGIGYTAQFLVPMRAAPTVDHFVGVSQSNCTGSISSIGIVSYNVYATSSAAGGVAYQGGVWFTAEL